MGLIRLFLALVVAGDHFTDNVIAREGLTEHHGIDQWIWMNGSFSVMFFYVISGFLISYVLERRYNYKNSTLAFYKSRFTRIFSLYWPVLIFVITTAPFLWESSWIDRFISLFIIGGDWTMAFHSYPKAYCPFPATISQTWSIATELSFYMIAPFLLRLPKIMLLCFIGSLGLRLVFEWNFGFHQAWDYHFPITALWFFLLGHLTQTIQMFRENKYIGVILLILSGIFIKLTMTDGSMISKYFYLSIICFALSLPWVFNTTKNNKIMNFLGNLSYPIYLIHVLVISFLYKNSSSWLIVKTPYFGVMQTMVMFLGLISVIALFLHYSIEKYISEQFR